MLERWEGKETIFLLTAPPGATPIFYGEGIDYSWSYARNYYRQLSLDKKKGKNFSKSVLEAISRDSLTTKQFCMFSRCAREYTILYKLMIHKQTLVGLDINLITNISVDLIHNMVKNFNMHR